MGKEVYIILTRGSDGQFTISTYETLDKAKAALDMYVEAQKDIEGLGSNVYIDYHELERLSVPGFVLRPDAIISHVTFNATANGKVVKTDRYLFKVKMG
jgi:hypothetical protein